MEEEMKKFNLTKAIVLCVLAMGCFYAAFAFAAVSGVSGMASQLKGALSPMAKLVSGASVVAGFGFALGAIFKFKAHKDNPQQIPIGTPIALLFIAVALLYMPFLFTRLGYQTFGSGASAATSSGLSSLACVGGNTPNV
jgi:intracellular multiplication protein IcmD